MAEVSIPVAIEYFVNNKVAFAAASAVAISANPVVATAEASGGVVSWAAIKSALFMGSFVLLKLLQLYQHVHMVQVLIRQIYAIMTQK